MNRWLPALIAYSAIVVAMLINDAKADQCSDFARLVEALTRAEEHQRPGLSAAWKRMVNDKKKIEIITRAYAFVAAGGSEGSAWKQCTTY